MVSLIHKILGIFTLCSLFSIGSSLAQQETLPSDSQQPAANAQAPIDAAEGPAAEVLPDVSPLEAAINNAKKENSIVTDEDVEALIGTRASSFVLPGSDGKQYAFNDYIGKIVVLEWYNSRCPFVNLRYDRELVQSRQKSYKEQGVIWFTILSAAPGKIGHMTAEEAEAMRKKHGGNQTAVLIDEEGVLAQAYKVIKIPQLVIIGQDARIAYAGALDELNRERDKLGVLQVSEVGNYAEEVVNALIDNRPAPVIYAKPTGCNLKR